MTSTHKFGQQINSARAREGGGAPRAREGGGAPRAQEGGCPSLFPRTGYSHQNFYYKFYRSKNAETLQPFLFYPDLEVMGTSIYLAPFCG